MGPWEIVGAIGQACFFGRVVVQWLASEKQKRSANPPAYWWISLAAALLVGLAALQLEEWILLPGYLINGAIYARNIRLNDSTAEERKSGLGPLPAGLLGLTTAALLIGWGLMNSEPESSMALHWIIAGILGQAIWSTRFILQWWLSERAGVSHFPLAFWWLSLAGSLLNLAYTLQLESPIFWIGFVTAWIVPIRNLMLEYKHRQNVS